MVVVNGGPDSVEFERNVVEAGIAVQGGPGPRDPAFLREVVEAVPPELQLGERVGRGEASAAALAGAHEQLQPLPLVARPVGRPARWLDPTGRWMPYALLPPALPIVAFRAGKRGGVVLWGLLAAGYTVLRMLG